MVLYTDCTHFGFVKYNQTGELLIVKRTRKKLYGSYASLAPRMPRGKRKWLVRDMSGNQERHRLFDFYEEAFEAYQHL